MTVRRKTMRVRTVFMVGMLVGAVFFWYMQRPGTDAEDGDIHAVPVRLPRADGRPPQGGDAEREEVWPSPAVVVPVPAAPADGPGRDPVVEVPELPDGGPDSDPAFRVVRFGDEAAARLAAQRAGEAGIGVRRLGRWVRVPEGQRGELAKLWGRDLEPVAEGYDHFIGLPPREMLREPPEGVVYVGVGEALDRALRLTGDHSEWGRGVRVAVVDSGVAFDALPRGVRAGEADFVEGGGLVDASHGTSVASQIVGGAQSFGTAPGARVLSARVVDASGSGSAFAAAEGVLWAVAQGASVINLSLSTRGDSAVLREAVAAARAAGVVVVAAAGNDGADQVSYPAAYEGVVAVGVVDAMGQLTYFSNRGAVDLVAPGVGVAATDAAGKLVEVSGTSIASPQVAGAAAALRSGDAAATVDEIVAALKRSAADWGEPGEDASYGAGLLDLGALAQQGEAGVVDVSVAPPLVRRSPESAADLEVTAVAQNRGSVVVAVLDLRVRVAGDERESTHYHVAPGKSVFMQWRVPAGSADSVLVEVEAFARGQEDRRPEDNRWRAYAGKL